jgi:hypothetical protein
MTQKERILNSLKAAGGLGVRSDVYIRDFMPRAAARVQELREEGWDISSEPDGKYVVWTLNVGVDAGCSRQQAGESQTASIHSGVADSASSLAPAEAPPANFYANEVWEDAA